ncbi:hypothetical protein SLE2022_184570 [Rubroshorea leprosula]
MSSICNTILDSQFTQQKWVAKITEVLNRELENDTDAPVCIFRVPKSLRDHKPEAYTPQLIALGPYYHLNSELYEMQRYKIVLAKMFSNQYQLVEIQQLVDQLLTIVPKIRHSYRGRLNLENQTLAMIFTVDGLFLLQLLDNYVKQKEIPRTSSLSSSLLVHSSSGKKLPGDAILRDVLMLENQIPRFVLLEILAKMSCLGSTSPDKFLSTLFLDFCKVISPIKVERCNPESEVLEHEHLLDLLYQYITYKDEKEHRLTEYHSQKSREGFDIEANLNTSANSNVFSKLWSKISEINIGFLRIFTQFIDLFLNILAHLGISATAFFNDKKVLIPSVSELWIAQMRFAPATGGTRYVEFNEKTNTLYLPIITLNPTSEVLIKNLVAYETMEKSDALSFRRFSELMGAIIDTVEDVELLRKSKVLESEMSSAEIAEIFNGMTKTMESKDRIIDTAIKKANASYNNTQKVRKKRLLKKYIYSSWRFLTVFASVLLLLLMGLQTFCNVYSCPTMFGRAVKA